MPPPNTPHRNPWKVLLVAVLACALVFGLVIAAGVSWVMSSRAKQQRAIAQERRARLIQFDRATNEIPRARPATREVWQEVFEPAQRDGASVSAISTNRAKNAILAPFRKETDSFPGDDLFRDMVIPKLDIVVPARGMSSLNRQPRQYVRATVHEGETVYTNVAIHLKGGPGSYRPLHDHPALTLNFEKFAPGQTFHGLKKIHLNNSVQDRGLMSEKISRELFEAAGVPAPRAGNAVVTLNETPLGMYVLVEGINKQFLKRYFKDAGGNVYDGHSGNDVNQDMDVNDGDNPDDKTRLAALARAVREPNLDLRLEAVEKTLDLDRFLSFVAMEMILWHWDGYTMSPNNFRIFHDRDTDRMVFIPQGLDQVLSRPQGAILDAKGGMVARSVMQIPEVRRRYHERVAEITTNVFLVQPITDRINEVAERIEETLAETNPGAASSHRRQANSLIAKVRQRAAFLQNRIYPATPANFGENGVLALKDWRSQKDIGEEVTFNQERDQEGNIFLRISSPAGCTASWRTSKFLDSGTYRFEARLKTEGVDLNPNDPRAGAGLRISRHRIGQKNSGDNDWTPVTFEFEVPENQTDVELVCELRANQGTVWFDLKSLKLRRL